MVWLLAAGKLRALNSLVQATSPLARGPAVAAWVRALLSTHYAPLQALWPAASHPAALATEALLDLAVAVRHTSLTAGLYDMLPAYRSVGIDALYTVATAPLVGPSLRAIGQTADEDAYAWLRAQYAATQRAEAREQLLRALAAVVTYAQPAPPPLGTGRSPHGVPRMAGPRWSTRRWRLRSAQRCGSRMCRCWPPPSPATQTPRSASRDVNAARLRLLTCMHRHRHGRLSRESGRGWHSWILGHSCCPRWSAPSWHPFPPPPTPSPTPRYRPRPSVAIDTA
jgi:hypothetical protein